MRRPFVIALLLTLLFVAYMFQDEAVMILKVIGYIAAGCIILALIGDRANPKEYR